METVYGGQWIKSGPLPKMRVCSLCNGKFNLACTVGWLSIKTGEWRCKQCFDPRRDDENQRT